VMLNAMMNVLSVIVDAMKVSLGFSQLE
jgi:hypothetical protein